MSTCRCKICSGSDWPLGGHSNTSLPTAGYSSPRTTSTSLDHPISAINGLIPFRRTDSWRPFRDVPFYVTNESEQRTYRGRVNSDGTLSQLRLFTEQGGESLAQDSHGNVWLAAGQIFVYSPSGKLVETVQVPERPLQIVFGGKDARTLFILTQSSLYAVRTR